MPNLTDEQQRIRSLIEVLGMTSASRLGIEDTWGFLNALLTVAWGENSWTSPAQGDIDIDGRPSYGVFQIRPGHKGVMKTPGELLDPNVNIAFAADYLGEVYKKYEDQGIASWQEIVPHLFKEGQIAAVDRPDVQANIQNAISFMEAQIGAVSYTPPTTVDEGELVRPKPEDFVNPLDYWTALSMYEDIKAGAPSIGPDEIAFINASINLIAAQMSEGQLDVQKADLEMRRKLGALEEAGRTYRELAPYALPEGTEWIPGGEPGGIYEKIGLGPMPAATTRINPLAAALATMGPPAEIAPAPDMSVEAVMAGARQLGMGAAPAATAPSPLDAALETAAPTTPTGGALTMPPMREDIPLTSVGAIPSAEGPSAELSPEEADRIAQIIFAILGGIGGGEGLGSMVPQPGQPRSPQSPNILQQVLNAMGRPWR